MQKQPEGVDSIYHLFVVIADDKDKFVKIHYKAKLVVSKEEMNEKKARDKEKRDAKNMDVLYITQETAVAFYQEFCDKKTPDLVDKIITCQACLGLRIIEVLSKKVSNYLKEGDKISQYGTAKTQTNKYVKLSDKVCTKKPVIITADKFMELIGQVRKETDKFDLDNEDMTAKYDAKVNLRVIKYLRKVGIPPHNELKSSHGLRRLFVSFSYSLREHHNMTFELWIQKMLAHDSSGSTMNYNTIKITTAKLLDEDSAAKLNLTYNNTIELKQEIANLEEKIDDITPVAIAPTAVRALRPATIESFKKIKTLLDSGVRSYKDMTTNGIPHNMYNKYKKLHNI